MMKRDERRKRIREVRRRLVQEGPPWTRDREADFETVTVPERDCDQLRDLLISEGVQTVVEVGLAYASSALAIGEALVTVNPPRPRHVIIDPFQECDWSNAGWDLLCSAGLDSIASLMLAPSSIAPATPHRRPRRRCGIRGRRSPVPRSLRRSLFPTQDRPTRRTDCHRRRRDSVSADRCALLRAEPGVDGDSRCLPGRSLGDGCRRPPGRTGASLQGHSPA